MRCTRPASLLAAVTPPTRAPIDVPAIATTSYPRSASTCSTPMWAYPRAPPEPRASATRVLTVHLPSARHRRSAVGASRLNTPGSHPFGARIDPTHGWVKHADTYQRTP
jgi:hypothetical protein